MEKDNLSYPGDFHPHLNWVRLPVKVFGCLYDGLISVYETKRPGELKPCVSLLVPVHFIPFDLRMPNSEFDIIYLYLPTDPNMELVWKTEKSGVVKVIRSNEIYNPKEHGLEWKPLDFNR